MFLRTRERHRARPSASHEVTAAMRHISIAIITIACSADLATKGYAAVPQSTTQEVPAAKKSAKKSATTATKSAAATPPAKPAAKSASQTATPKAQGPKSTTAVVATSPPATTTTEPAQPTLEETRLTLAKWIETQQIIAKERNDWQQGKEILQGRVELVGKEAELLKEKITHGETALVESNKKRDQLVVENDILKATTAQLSSAVTVMEGEVRNLAKLTPAPVAERLLPLLQRIPADPSTARVSTAERFQNVLGILNELNKVNSEISVTYEIRTLADGSSTEVQVIYIGLAQAYYISPRGDAGIGRPSDDGWKWEPAPATSADVLRALEIIQGKHSPAFVPLPMKIQ